MKTILCAVSTVLALTLAAPVVAEDKADGAWAPWATDAAEAPAPQIRPTAPAVTRVVAQAAPPQQTVEIVSHRLLRMERFWVIGSFR
jgi:hypothetical protein